MKKTAAQRRTDDARVLAKWLSLFTVEARKKMALSIRLQQFICCFVVDKQDVHFHEFHGTLESVLQALHSEGVGAVVKYAPLIHDYLTNSKCNENP